jgi:hypothetical protein
MPNAKLNLDVGRQKALFAEVAFDFSHVQDNGVAVPAVKLPYGAQIVGGAVTVDTAFNPGTSLVLDVGDSTVANRYINDANLASVGRTPLGITGFVSDGSAIQIVPVLVGAAPTQGKARLLVTYVIKGRAEEVQP